MQSYCARTVGRCVSTLVLLLGAAVPGRSNTIVVDLAGYVSSFNSSNTTSVSSNSVVGPILNAPPLFPGTTTVIPEGTPFTARFTFNTALMPAVTNVDSGGVNAGLPFPTHDEQGLVQWATFELSLGGFTFDTFARDADTPPTATPPQFLSVNTPLSYGNRVAYGEATVFGSQAFHGASSLQTNYLFFDPNDPNALSRAVFRSGDFRFTLYRSNFINDPFLPPGPGIPESFQWVDGSAPQIFAEFGTLTVFYTEGEARGYQDGSDVMLEQSFRSMQGLFRVTSATAYEAPVPEPSGMVMVAVGLVAVVVRRRLRHG